MARIDWERDWPIVAAVGLGVVGAVWASRYRTEVTQRMVTLQPPPVDVAGIVQAQVAAQQGRLQAAVGLATQYTQAVVALEQSKLQASVQQQQIAAALEAARLQSQAEIEIARLQAEAAKAQYQAQQQAVAAQAQAQSQVAFWGFLGAVLPALFGLFSRQRTEQAAVRRNLLSRPLAAQAQSTWQVLEAVA